MPLTPERLAGLVQEEWEFVELLIDEHRWIGEVSEVTHWVVKTQTFFILGFPGTCLYSAQ